MPHLSQAIISLTLPQQLHAQSAIAIRPAVTPDGLFYHDSCMLSQP